MHNNINIFSTAGGNDLPGLTSGELSRYSRHIKLSEVGMEGQRKLKAAKVLVAGLGGLGSPVTLYLTAGGIGTIGMVDFDVVDESNLHRQILYGTDCIGKSKLKAAKARLKNLNPHVNFICREEKLTSGNAMDIIKDYDMVIDCTDNFPSKYLLNDACVLLNKPNVYGSVFRFEGKVSVFHYNGGPCCRCLYPELPPPGLIPSCEESGVIGVLPGIIGSIKAAEAIKIILGVGETLTGRLLLIDTLTMKFSEVRVKRNEKCPVCGDDPEIKKITG